MSILMGISILLALLWVKTRASGTRNGLFEATKFPAAGNTVADRYLLSQIVFKLIAKD